MQHNQGAHIIHTFRKKWVFNNILSAVLFAAAGSIMAAVLLHKIFATAWWYAAPVFAVLSAMAIMAKPAWKVADADVARFLNKQYPSLEESCGLLLLPPETLNLLEGLQAAKTAEALHQLTSTPKAFYHSLRIAFITLVCTALVSTGLYAVPFHWHNAAVKEAIVTNTSNPPGKLLPGVTGVTIKAEPPAYTKLAAYTQQQFNIQVQEGALLTWRITTNTAVHLMRLVFNDSTVLVLKPADKTNTLWQASKPVAKSGFYQLVMESNTSEFYKIEVVKDQAPVIIVTSPKPNTTVEYWAPQRVTISASVADDYGIKDAQLIATTASGSGEGVKFKEQKIAFPTSFGGQLKQYQLQRLIDLNALGMQPGDELYMYVRAVDNNNQEKRSDILIVTLADTVVPAEAEGIVNGVKLKPEYFRSERQIIIEAEQLLKDKDTITVEEFNTRSNNLGIDQKLLRLRYGKFLGEEAEETEGAFDNEKNAVLSDPNNFGNAGVVLDAFTDKHDNAEDASFLDAATKQQLKNTLTEMWNAELRLRTFKPKEALPFAYKALIMLKDLQQKSRAYVPKTTFKTAPLKPEKRLTGELDKILQPVEQGTTVRNTGTGGTVAAALNVLEQLKAGNVPAANNLPLLAQAMQLLAGKAATEPAAYVNGLQALKEVLAALQNKKSVQIKDINVVENALQKMAAAPAQLPQKQEGAPYNALQQQYFNNLHKNSNH
jgi:hypothetical protein